MNHAEPDHASAVGYVLSESPDARLVTTAKGAQMAKLYFKVPDDRIQVVKDGDSLDLGGKTLKFIEAPWLHWPETMFTYAVEDKVLFPCDFFGAHTAFGMYDDENEGLIPLAQRYYGEIMMPFGRMGARALEKIEALDIRLIAPSHGPIYRNPGRIVDEYRKWTAGETREKAIIAFVSMWGSTDRMAKAMAEALENRGIEVAVFNLQGADIGDIARELVDARALVLGSPTVLGGLHPLASYAVSLVKALRPPREVRRLRRVLRLGRRRAAAGAGTDRPAEDRGRRRRRHPWPARRRSHGQGGRAGTAALAQDQGQVWPGSPARRECRLEGTRLHRIEIGALWRLNSFISYDVHRSLSNIYRLIVIINIDRYAWPASRKT